MTQTFSILMNAIVVNTVKSDIIVHHCIRVQSVKFFVLESSLPILKGVVEDILVVSGDGYQWCGNRSLQITAQ